MIRTSAYTLVKKSRPIRIKLMSTDWEVKMNELENKVAQHEYYFNSMKTKLNELKDKYVNNDEIIDILEKLESAFRI